MQIKPPGATRTERPAGAKNTAGGPAVSRKPFSLDGPPPASSKKILRVDPQRPSSLPAAVEDVERQRQAIDRLLEQARRGRSFSPQELLGLQATVYRYNENVEVLSRVVDKSVGALKTLLNTQV